MNNRFDVNNEVNVADLGVLLGESIFNLKDKNYEFLQDNLLAVHSMIYPNASSSKVKEKDSLNGKKSINDCIKDVLYLLRRAEKMSIAVYTASTILDLNSTTLDETQLIGLSTLLESAQTDFDNECHIHHTSIDTLKTIVE
jgi:hypothetical protein